MSSVPAKLVQIYNKIVLAPRLVIFKRKISFFLFIHLAKLPQFCDKDC